MGCIQCTGGAVYKSLSKSEPKSIQTISLKLFIYIFFKKRQNMNSSQFKKVWKENIPNFDNDNFR